MQIKDQWADMIRHLRVVIQIIFLIKKTNSSKMFQVSQINKCTAKLGEESRGSYIQSPALWPPQVGQFVRRSMCHV